MMRPAIELQEQGEAYYFIANYHSMTSLFDADERRKNTLDVALDFLACGLDPKKSVFFKQSDVPEVTELAWMLTTLTPMGLLERGTSYKDKIARGIAPNHGMFAYPVLMAADILIYDSNVVPVGRDQKQHVEMTRDMAVKFNETYGQTFVIPEPQNPRGSGAGARHGRPEDEQELRQHDRDFWRRKGHSQKNHGPGDGQPHARGAEAGRGKKSGDSIAQAGRAGAMWRRILRTGCAPAAWATAI